MAIKHIIVCLCKHHVNLLLQVIYYAVINLRSVSTNKLLYEEKCCRDTLATVHDSYNGVVEICSSSISTTACDRLKKRSDGYVLMDIKTTAW
jgi:hypothetical protein